MRGITDRDPLVDEQSGGFREERQEFYEGRLATRRSQPPFCFGVLKGFLGKETFEGKWKFSGTGFGGDNLQL